ncbi:MAG TPA: adenylosuccinate lyase [Chitinophagaceae bacterium]|nr:adenylosuccinate lyase [Chitinophagaceae bacterium]
MSLNPLTAISPVDGRYYNKLTSFSDYFSEFALIKYRVKVEVEYFLALSKEGVFAFPDEKKADFRRIVSDFSLEDAQKIKDTEKVTNHDVKAVEYFVKEKLEELDCGDKSEWVHFGLTSQDINNTATPLMWKDGLKSVYLPELVQIIDELKNLVNEWKDIPLLARTHGQPASPTKLGKELAVFVQRLEKQKKQLEQIPFAAKFGGATGNFNAHHVAYPEKDWEAFANEFVNETLALERTTLTTQIEPYDDFAAQFDALKRINNIFVDLCRDIWTYISMEYFKQKIKKGEVGSSTMPHKVNPIDFENAEGNFGVANALFTHLSAKLPISRLQRDLTDSTVLRNIGMPLSHSFLALTSLRKGLGKLILNNQKLDADLEANWAVVAEAIQTILRREHFPKPYEALKELTRKNKHINQDAILEFIDTLAINENVKEELRQITPQNYTGIF